MPEDEWQALDPPRTTSRPRLTRGPAHLATGIGSQSTATCGKDGLKPTKLSDVIIWRWEYYDPKVLLFNLERGQDLYSDDRLYALANLFPDRFEQSSFHELPQIDPLRTFRSWP